MTHHDHHSHAHSHGHSHSAQDPWAQLPEGFAERLGLEALLSTPVQESAIKLLSSTLEGTAERIVDLGSGSGAGTVALAEAFPHARIHAVDLSEQLLEKVRDAAEQADVSERVQIHRADLNEGWPVEIPTGVDAIWASLSLHHVETPSEVLRQIHDALRPGGVFVLIETPGDARFEPADLGTGRSGLGDRVLDLVRHVADFDTDWDSALEVAGLTVEESQQLEFAASSADIDGAKYLHSQLRAHQEQLRESGASEDADALDMALEALEEDNSDVAYRAGRTVWVARRA